MMIQTANKASSGSTCVLVRMVMEGEILFSGGTDRGAMQSPSSSRFSCTLGPAVLFLSPFRTCDVLVGHKGESAS